MSEKRSARRHIIVCCALIIILIISLIPIFLIAGYDCASGDDYNYGARSHLAFIATGSVLEAVKAAFSTTAMTWEGWQGTWFDCFVFSLHPEVFSDTAYVIVPYIFVSMQIVCFFIFAHHFLKIRWKLGNYYWLEVGLIFLIFSFQLVPSQKSAIFWWVGSVHYAMPMCMTVVGIVLADNFLAEHKVRDLVGLTVIATLLGGATYPAIILMTLAIILLSLEKVVIGRKRDKKDCFLLFPFGLEMIGFVISAVAPGNAVRSASDIARGAKPSGGALATILKSIVFSAQDALGCFIAEKTFVLIAVIMICILTVFVLSGAENKDEIKEIFSHPGLFVLVMFLLNASVYAPRLYAGGEVSSGYYNFNFWTFFVCLISSCIYLVSFCYFKLDKQKNMPFIKMAAYAAACIGVILIAFVGRHDVKAYTDYICMNYYLSGQADDYKEQMKLQRMLMTEEGIEDVVVPAVNDLQGPLMQMPIVGNPQNIDNRMAASFYGKKSCRAIPRQEWIAKYGDKYNIN